MNRQASLDILKLSMALMVVGLHGHFLADVSTVTSYLLIQGIFRIAVPTFLLINGFYLYSTLEANRLGVWLKRMITLYLCWTLFYAYTWWPSDPSTLESIYLITRTLIIGYFHLWYISGLIGAGVLMYLVHKWSTRSLIVLLMATFIGGVAIQYIGSYHLLGDSLIDNLFNRFVAHRNFLFLSFPFLCLGYLIRKHSLHEKITSRQSLALLGISTLFLLAESFANYYFVGPKVSFDNLIFIFLVCPALFLFTIRQNVAIDGKSLAAYSAAIYFIHPCIIRFLEHTFSLNDTPLTIATVLISIPAAWLIIQANRKVGVLL
ncbi:acyltransferase family protein [Blastopirellula marina]|uniref:Acyltransferase 3 domain-containing protein n=1 Tax=Blastopirellula marina TaxID=124 RepID=A0A2S8G8Q5_9BACT|nr:acyltransferase [Blastopirellula marina]PQO40835.1 hypothetical protein C5Y98_04460 [Blastopirellula marina]PTL45717.1 hypothetical protein C5Y97_04460 [Blastopirellula marina]